MNFRHIPLVLLTFFLLLILQTARAQTIINTEKLQKNAKMGWFGGLNANVDLERGNSNLLEITGNSIIGYEQKRYAIKLFSGLKFLRENKNTVTSRRYAQLRFNYIFNSRYRTFTFYQYQHNKNLILNSRQLVGAGLRRSFGTGGKTIFDLGLGLMYENEKLDAAQLQPFESATENTFRFDILGFLSYEINSNSTLMDAVYFQPSVTNPGNFRLLNDLSLEVAITHYLGLTLSFIWRHDSDPPQVLKKSDIQVTSGISLKI